MGTRKEIGINTKVSQAMGIVAADMDGEKAMLNIEQGKYYGLDGVGSRIWELIDTPRTIREVVAILLTEYDVDEKKCHQDVMGFLLKLSAQGLVEIA